MRSAVLLALVALAPRIVAAQDRLVGLRAVTGAATIEGLRFGGDGVPQPAFGDHDSLRVRSVQQMAVPVTAAFPLGSAWTVDLTSVYVSGTVAYDTPGAPALGRRHVTLSGLGDVRVRAVGRLMGDALIVTMGANAPTGRDRLTPTRLGAVRVLAAPMLGIASPPLGAGGSATLGLLTAHAVGAWAVAGGLSYELHDSYAPIGALVAGAPTTDYRPGDVLSLSLGGDRLVGRHRLSLGVTADAFGTDRLRATEAGATDAGATALATVRLGPVVTGEAQLQLAVPAAREATIWIANRWRGGFARNGVTVNASSGNAVSGGLRTTIPMTPRTDVTLAADARAQQGLGFDDSILSATGTAGTVTVGVRRSLGALTLQPYVRGQLGRIVVRDGATRSMAGGAVGFSMLSRF